MSLRIGAVIRRVSKVDLAPQKVAETNASDATRDTFQRKVFYDNVNFFVFYWDEPSLTIKYASSKDGRLWKPYSLITFTAKPFYGGNVDVEHRLGVDKYGRRYNVGLAFLSPTGYTWWLYNYWIQGSTLSRYGPDGFLYAYSYSGVKAKGRSVTISLDGSHEIWATHATDGVALGEWASVKTRSTAVPYIKDTTGGVQILKYKSSSPYTLFLLVKGGDSVLYFSKVAGDGSAFLGTFSEIATLGEGFSDFCGASEAQNIGDSEIIDMVYIKSTGELVHRSFLNDALTDEKVLCSSGASYPVIAIGKGGRRYVFYVKDGVIKMQKLLNINGAVSILTPERTLFPRHNYRNPVYLSTNQNAQHRKICLVWTEGFSPPFEVWFCYLRD